jgi:hypothetical protein
MGKHDGRNTDPEMTRIGDGPEPTGEPTRLADLVRDDVPRDENGDPKEPTNPDLFGEDPFYDGDKRSHSAVWALALCGVIVAIVIGGGGYMFGLGEAKPVGSETNTKIITTTEMITAPAARPAPAPKVTVTVTRKSQPSLIPAPTITKTAIMTKTIAPQSTLTAYRTLPRVTATVRATITRTAFSEPSTAYRCFRVRRDGVQIEIPCP